MPDTSWVCQSCKERNPPYTEACRECGASPNILEAREACPETPTIIEICKKPMNYYSFNRVMPPAKQGTAIFVAVLLSVPVAGFGCGVYFCSDCGVNPIYYLLIGLVHSVLTVFTVGRCNIDFGFSYSIWPYLPISVLFIYLLFVLLNYLSAYVSRNKP